MSDVHNDIRSKRAVVTCLRDLGNGLSKLIFDDVVSESASNPRIGRSNLSTRGASILMRISMR